MLKFFFWVLLLANIAVFAYQRGYLGIPDGHEPERAANQLNADKIGLLSASAASAMTAAQAEAKAPEKTAESSACTELGNFTQSEAQRFDAKLAALSLANKATHINVKEVASHMVYIPPQADKEATEKKAGQLRQMGVTDFFIIQENSNMKWGISLGVFKTEEAAQNQLANLVKLGVRSARIGARSVVTTKLVYQFHDLDPAAKASLDKIKADFPGQEMRACQPAAQTTAEPKPA